MVAPMRGVGSPRARRPDLDSLLNGILEILIRIDITSENRGDQFISVSGRGNRAPYLIGAGRIKTGSGGAGIICKVDIPEFTDCCQFCSIGRRSQ